MKNWLNTECWTNNAGYFCRSRENGNPEKDKRLDSRLPRVKLRFYRGLSGIFPETKRDSGQARMSAPESVRGRRGGSPLQAYALRPVTDPESFRDTARRGGEQREVNNQSVG